MPDRANAIRKTAAKCLALARTTTDPNRRTALFSMAQKLCEVADRCPVTDFEAVGWNFKNDQPSRH